ncbi:hypothetical protein K505DRAFT_93812 [Melanomma pulvis-pyrius CBS 109.77]|uniref:Uncharacterized protein n=1 Tax=Melanomma pulvis-pyrius CBS 109.77 TaxID=1314802 RepID=A0A6A6XWE7_9PLEO|nr:hypothetical protein K505DRAFT_93812 [Melanomma pulvis-pyrius CBS 109.77]
MCRPEIRPEFDRSSFTPSPPSSIRAIYVCSCLQFCFSCGYSRPYSHIGDCSEEMPPPSRLDDGITRIRNADADVRTDSYFRCSSVEFVPGEFDREASSFVCCM